MLSKRSILIFFFFLTVKKSKIVRAEWVEIPQFSDETKVYRVPLTKYVHGEKYFLESQRRPTFHNFPNISIVDEGFQKVKIQQQSSSPRPSLSSGISPPISATTEIVHKFENNEASSTQSPPKITDFSEDTVFDDEAATVEVEDEEVTVTTNPSDEEKVIAEKGQPYQFNSGTKRPQIDEKPKKENQSNGGFFAFIPMELFKKVHATLQSQPKTMKGKLEYLKRFEQTLLAEIEKRLVSAMTPVRRKRESRGSHGWDEHDDSVGFPSLEGALMAISFLAFAVYLVRLVMMLFRNLGNPATTQPGTATFLVNRNKRSAEKFTEDTARILTYLDDFDKNQYPQN